MEGVKSWVFSVCMTGIAATVVQMLIPKGNMEKIFKIVVRVFFLSVLVSPFVVNIGMEKNINSNYQFKTEDYTQAFRESAEGLIEQGLSEQIEQMLVASLKEIDVTTDNISVVVECVNENSAEIRDIYITLKENYKIKEIDIRYKISTIANCGVTLVYV